MKIAGAHWSKEVNWLDISCKCGTAFYHRADRWNVECPDCKKSTHLGILRRAYVYYAQKDMKSDQTT